MSARSYSPVSGLAHLQIIMSQKRERSLENIHRGVTLSKRSYIVSGSNKTNIQLQQEECCCMTVRITVMCLTKKTKFDKQSLALHISRKQLSNIVLEEISLIVYL